MTRLSAATAAKDPATNGGRARAIDKGPCGDVLYASNFGQNYFDGWRASHFGGNQAGMPIGLVSYPTHSSKLALQLSTEMRNYASGNLGTQCATFRGLSIYTSRRFLSYSAFLAAGVGGLTQSWAEFGMMLDIQKVDNSSRSFPWILLQSAASPTFSKARIKDNSGTEIDIPGTTHLWTGDNENKQNFGYLRLTWDLQANGGLGGYYRAQVQNQVFDLTGLAGQSADFTPQSAATTGGGTIEEYNGGLNMGLYITRDTSQTTIYPATLLADSIVLSAHD